MLTIESAAAVGAGIWDTNFGTLARDTTSKRYSVAALIEACCGTKRTFCVNTPLMSDQDLTSSESADFDQLQETFTPIEGLPDILHTPPVPVDQGGTIGPFPVFFPSDYPFNRKPGVRSLAGDEALRFTWRAFRHPRLKKCWYLVASAVCTDANTSPNRCPVRELSCHTCSGTISACNCSGTGEPKLCRAYSLWRL